MPKTNAVENIEALKLTVSPDATQGTKPSSATVVIIKFGDFECPFCARHAATALPLLKREFIDAGRLAYFFEHFPLETIHPSAVHAAALAKCSANQGRFWPMHDKLFGRPAAFEQSMLLAAQQANLDYSQLTECLRDAPAAVRRTIRFAKTMLGVKSTPTFYFGVFDADGGLSLKRRLNGAAAYALLKATVAELLNGNPDRSESGVVSGKPVR